MQYKAKQIKQRSIKYNGRSKMNHTVLIANLDCEVYCPLKELEFEN